jgi:glycosyltransferase involved in cell wall biosynthesis
VREAIESVLSQTYTNIQLIVLDDASTDNSVEVIKQIVGKHPSVEFLPLPDNLGNCKAFNRGLALAKGDFLIDLAADDVLLPNRIEVGVRELLQISQDYGVHFSDAELISEGGAHLGLHSTRFPHDSIPQGDIYKELIKRYFICPPTVMFTREVMNHLEGYDETLTYEDFDFWIRSSRGFKYIYSREVLMKRRIAANAMGKRQFALFSIYSRSTFKVCEKILLLNKTPEEQEALSRRIWYEVKLNLRLLNGWIVWKYFSLWLRNRLDNPTDNR